jgi:[glutamine synthetase] adenylyltransferase / [glutamine synthetase]-adenylyl-L-tyrosine phosphorylase
MTRSSTSPTLQSLPALRPPSEHSRFAQRVRRRYAAQLHGLAPGFPDPKAMQATFDALLADGTELGTALRTLRHLVIERLVCLDCENQASLEEVTAVMTNLAEFTLNQAYSSALHMLDQLHGAPSTPGGQRASLWVVGMGKLGARELNVSSDIDLIYVFDQDGDTAFSAADQVRISNQEYFSKAVRAIFALIGETTEHGIVFRVDLALRPNGNSGPPAVSLDALESYFHAQGREWERFAWLKSRVIAPGTLALDDSARALRKLVIPFVFRRYLDYGVFDALRVLHRQIRDHAAKRSAGHPERANDVKLSRGGIREIEFTVQLLQVVRGGQFPELRTRPTLKALQRLAKAGLMPQTQANALAQAYIFLRQVEHRIQYLDDLQTHLLPTSDEDLNWVALTLGFSEAAAFLSQLNLHREVVAQEFDKLLGGHATRDCTSCFGDGKGQEIAIELDRRASTLPMEFLQRVHTWRDHPRVLALREASRNRLIRLVNRTAQWLQEEAVSLAAALRLIDWMEPMMRRESYISLLLERPQVHERLLRLLGSAKWPARYLLLHPGVIDELASSDMVNQRFVSESFEAEVELRRSTLMAAGQDDDEALLDVLRRAHHAEVFRTLARDLEGKMTVEQVADDLSALAETVLRISSHWCWERLKKKHRAQHQFAIIAYGKLGGRELGYGSDLDIVFVYDDEDEHASEVYASLVRKMINWLTVQTGEGHLYDIDTALRPNGNSGLLVTTFDAYARYQQQRGSNTAWTWEHQAMTRARCVLGSAALHKRFDEVRRAVVCASRDAEQLRLEIRLMRDKVRAAHPITPGLFDVKHSPGGMVDAEFTVQYLVLSQSTRHPELIANRGNIALLLAAQACGLLPAGVGEAAANAYRVLRRMQHQARLNEEPTQVDPGLVTSERQAVIDLWRCVFS